jgi:hypothetical protein
MSDTPPTFDEAIVDAEDLAKMLSGDLALLKPRMTNAGIRKTPEGRRLAATIERHRRVTKILIEQLQTARDKARKVETLRRLGKAPKEWAMVPPRRKR